MSPRRTVASTSVVGGSAEDGPPLPAAQRSADRLELVSRHLAGAAVGDEFELDLLAFGQVRHTSTLDGADMDESIGTAVIRLDESEALRRVEPLHCSLSHGNIRSEERRVG